MSRSGIALLISASGLSLLSANTIGAYVIGREAALVRPGPVFTGVLLTAAILWMTYAVLRAADRIVRKIEESTRDANARAYAESVGVSLPREPVAYAGKRRHVWPLD